MVILGYPWISMDVHGYPYGYRFPLTSTDIHRYSPMWVSMDINGFRGYPGISMDID